jgi:hypothetical protein
MLKKIDDRPAPPEWIASLERSEAELAAGLTVTSDFVHSVIRGQRDDDRANHDPLPRAGASGEP